MVAARYELITFHIELQCSTDSEWKDISYTCSTQRSYGARELPTAPGDYQPYPSINERSPTAVTAGMSDRVPNVRATSSLRQQDVGVNALWVPTLYTLCRKAPGPSAPPTYSGKFHPRWVHFPSVVDCIRAIARACSTLASPAAKWASLACDPSGPVAGHRKAAPVALLYRCATERRDTWRWPHSGKRSATAAIDPFESRTDRTDILHVTTGWVRTP